MKKLMIAAVAAAMAGGAYAAPQVFDFKASVKHMYLKEVKVNIKGGFNGLVYQKYVKSASLKGYLIMDQDGLTSQTISGAAGTAMDYGRNRGFLVVQNSSAEKQVRKPKIIPAVLDAKWIDTAFKQNHGVKTGLAEGTLFLGGDSVACVRTQLDDLAATVTERGAAPAAPAAGTPGMVAYADYVWTSVYLFGQFNGPNWFQTAANVTPFDEFENAWDGNLPTDLQRGVVSMNYFHDTWMNGAGVGKYTTPAATTAGDLCCGLKKTITKYARILDTLSGNLKGGLFLCTENGIDVRGNAYQWFDGTAWEDQFNCARLDVAGTFAPDAWQNDMWQDGAMEQETTDVIYGTWSIKNNAKFFAAKGGIARDPSEKEMQEVLDDNTFKLGDSYFARGNSLVPVWGAIFGAAEKLDKTVNVYDGSEIYAKSADQRFVLPMVTPQFITYYGLK